MMAENPKISIVSETLRNLGEYDFAAAGDTLRHEGLKKGIESGLYVAGQSELGRSVVSRLAGDEVDEEVLRTNVSGLDMEGPIGIAPGWDKTGKTIHAWQAAGAHHITIGGITRFAQAGNRMPRLRTMDRRLGDHGVAVSLNSFGFWNPGADKIVYNIQKQQELGRITIPIIPQVTINKEFYEEGDLSLIGKLVGMTVKKVLPVASAISLGLTSPNTKGMREAQDAGDRFFLSLVGPARDAIDRSDYDVPIIFKGDGDGGEAQLEMYCKWVEYREEMIDAFELINTTALPHVKAKYDLEDTPGGLAGADAEYQELALGAIKYVYEAVGNRVDIIATGGCDSGLQALAMIENGGSAVGINTAVRKLGIKGPRIIERELARIIGMRYPEATALDQVIGTATARGPKHLTRENPADKAANIANRIARGTQSERSE